MASEMPSIGPTTLAEAPAIGPPAVGRACDNDEEAVLLYVLRLLNRMAHRNVLSPVERAFVEGARTTFDSLATTCGTLLDTATTEREFYAGAADDAPLKSVGRTKRTKRAKRASK